MKNECAARAADLAALYIHHIIMLHTSIRALSLANTYHTRRTRANRFQWLGKARNKHVQKNAPKVVPHQIPPI